MIEWKTGDIWKSKAEYLIVTVNGVGVMGKGIALECKQRFPLVFHEYQTKCKLGKVTPGSIHLVPTGQNYPRFIMLVATKDHWRDPSRIEWIDQILSSLPTGPGWIYRIAMPPLGCGNGGLNWKKDVKPLVIKYLNQCPNITYEVYEPQELKNYRHTLNLPHTNFP